VGNPVARPGKHILIPLRGTALTVLRNLILRFVPNSPKVLCLLFWASAMTTTRRLFLRSLGRIKANYSKVFGSSIDSYLPTPEIQLLIIRPD